MGKRNPKNIGPVGREVFSNTVASSLLMYKTWEHVNTLFSACINDHGETHNPSTRAINKRWPTYKGSYPPHHPPPPLDPLRHISCQFSTLFYFCAAWGCGAAGVALNNEWRLFRSQTKSVQQKIQQGCTHIRWHTCTELLWSLLDSPWRKWGVNQSLGNCERKPGDGA